ncbi:MAG: response regulator [Chlorobium sp.]|nr:response regulator [Chlorobium sp.]
MRIDYEHSRSGYTGSSRLEAIDKFREHQSDINIVLCDISMPGMDGWETLANLRTMAPGILEAQVMQSDKLESPQAFLQKPFKKQDLQRVLKTLLPL